MNNLKYHLALIAANLGFGANYSFYSSLIGKEISSDSLFFMRTFSIFLFFVPLMIITKQAKIDIRDLWKFALVAVLVVVGRMFLMLKAMNYTSPIDGSIIATAGPILTMLVAAVAIHERITKPRIAGIVLGLAGAIIIIVSNAKEGSTTLLSGKMLGNLILFASIILSSCNTIFVKNIYKKYSPFTMLGWSYTLGMLFVIPMFSKSFIQTDFGSWSGGTWFELGYVIIFGTIIANALYYYGLRGVSPTSSSIYAYTQPVIATVLAIVRGQDKLTIITIASAAFIFSGVYLMIHRSALKHGASE